MSRNKDPAVLFYPESYLVGTRFMTYEQKGKYMELLCFQHQQGHLSEEDMLAICGEYDKRIFAKFVVDENGLYYNERMEEEIIRRNKYTEALRRNGEKGGRPKKPNENQLDNLSDIQQVTQSGNQLRNININVNEIKNVIEYLNSKLGTKYRYSTASIQKHIKARISEGATFEDFRTVIDKKYDEWMGTEFAKFLRPETLFGSKFHQYLNQIPSTPIKPKQTMARCGDFDAEEAFRLALERSNKED